LFCSTKRTYVITGKPLAGPPAIFRLNNWPPSPNHNDGDNRHGDSDENAGGYVAVDVDGCIKQI